MIIYINIKVCNCLKFKLKCLLALVSSFTNVTDVCNKKNNCEAFELFWNNGMVVHTFIHYRCLKSVVVNGN